MRFYHNIGLNTTAEEDWVIDYLYQNGETNSREEALEGLRTKREFCGWYDCEVSNTIMEVMEYGTLRF